MPETVGGARGDQPERGHELALLVADVYELAGALRRAGDALAARAGQTQARWQVLSVLSAGEWTVAAAARRLGISRQAVQRVADVLAAEGLVAFEPNPAHARAPLARLSPSGRAALEAINGAAAGWNEAVAGELSAPEIAATRRVLRGVLERARAVPAPP